MIDTKLLRQKILDLAIRGKLVPQDPKDEPASELLKKIKAEKEALIKAGKMKRDKHESFIFRGDDKRYYEQIDGKTADITTEIPSDLPDGWAWCRLASLVAILNGDRGKNYPAKSTLHQQGIPFVSAINIDKGNLLRETLLYLSQQQFDSLNAGKFKPGDILLCIRGSLGKYAVIRNTVGAIASSLVILRPYLFDDMPFVSVLQTWIESSLFGLEMKKYDNGTAQPNLAASDLGRFFIPLPPLAEQKRIVAQIESLLKCVDEIDRESATLEKSLALAKQKILDLAIRGRLVSQDPDDEPASELLKKIKAEKEALIKAGKLKRDKHESFIFRGDDNCYHENIDGKTSDISKEIPFNLPEGWAWCRLECIMYNIRTKDNQIKTGNILSSGMFPVVSQGQEDIDGFCDSKKKVIADIPVVLFGDHTKKVKYIDFPFVVGADGTKIFRPLSDAKWLFYWTSFAATTIGDRGYGRHWNLLQTQIVPLPPLAEQKRIVSRIEKLFSLLETMRV